MLTKSSQLQARWITGQVVALAMILALNLPAQRNRIIGPINNKRRVFLKGHIHPKAQADDDQGPVAASMPIPYATLMLKRSPSQEAELNQLLEQQQDPSSPNYHHWLTPDEYANRFGASQEDIDKITAWLKEQGFNVIGVARGRNWIAFSGDAAQVENAF